MRLLSLALLALLPAAVGCTGAVSPGAEGADAVGVVTTSALVTVERTSDGTSGTSGTRAEISGRFLRVVGAASSADALRAIGAALDLPAAGACVAQGSRGLAAAAPLPLVELVDVGAVSLEAAGVETRLLPRQLPDVTDIVSGTLYARAADPSLVPDSTRYTVRVGGRDGFEPLVASALAAGDPSAIRVAGEDAAGLTASGASIELTWPASGAGSDDVVYVDIRPAGVRCTLGEQGHGSLSTLLLDESGALVIHRLRREPLPAHARGLDSGELRFDFARSLPYVRR